MQGRDGAFRPEPGVDGDLVLVPVTEAAVVGQADVFLQLRDLTQHQPEEINHTRRVILKREDFVAFSPKRHTFVLCFPSACYIAPLPVDELMRRPSGDLGNKVSVAADVILD